MLARVLALVIPGGLAGSQGNARHNREVSYGMLSWAVLGQENAPHHPKLGPHGAGSQLA